MFLKNNLIKILFLFQVILSCLDPPWLLKRIPTARLYRLKPMQMNRSVKPILILLKMRVGKKVLPGSERSNGREPKTSRFPPVLILFNIFVGCSKFCQILLVLSGIIRYRQVSWRHKKHLDDPVPTGDFPVLHCLVIWSSVLGIRLYHIRKYMSKV